MYSYSTSGECSRNRGWCLVSFSGKVRQLKLLLTKFPSRPISLLQARSHLHRACFKKPKHKCSGAARHYRPEATVMSAGWQIGRSDTNGAACPATPGGNSGQSAQRFRWSLQARHADWKVRKPTCEEPAWYAAPPPPQCCVDAQAKQILPGLCALSLMGGFVLM